MKSLSRLNLSMCFLSHYQPMNSLTILTKLDRREGNWSFYYQNNSNGTSSKDGKSSFYIRVIVYWFYCIMQLLVSNDRVLNL